jgi:hypothetical protein
MFHKLSLHSCPLFSQILIVRLILIFLEKTFYHFIGKCINRKYVCDKYDNCGDNSDEGNDCPICRATQFQCKNGKCASKQNVCDGVNDCGDNSDEYQNCTCYEFTCSNKTCITFRLVFFKCIYEMRLFIFYLVSMFPCWNTSFCLIKQCNQLQRSVMLMSLVSHEKSVKIHTFVLVLSSLKNYLKCDTNEIATLSN